ncbi:hemerythrin domain-containing protein [Nitrosomonas sp. JL21]|uniref:hemerythrin domain-containing protein n=1 Tax=Nitrosomonas sp. JL21 TaxID=153949 RepID=UPI00136C969C|nr:hemerythrin domain-containing protein [Nitrosomonas sp. JL21]MBL8497426.1 hemerythrin domain-containing protein [Nitrosomonas sp.]MXS78688.1 hemerythrin domain-containing protein [Nitrosomonas sp. JL21]
MATSTRTTAKPLIKLLKEDHDKVTALFEEFEELHEKKNSHDEKAELVSLICKELTLHTLVEEKIVYPLARESIDDPDVMDEADVEHAGAKNLIKELEKMDPEDSHYDAKVTVLSEYIKHHVKEEEGIMFPKLEKAGIDGDEVVQEVLQFKEKHQDSKSNSRKSVAGKSSSQSTATHSVK